MTLLASTINFSRVSYVITVILAITVVGAVVEMKKDCLYHITFLKKSAMYSACYTNSVIFKYSLLPKQISFQLQYASL